MKSNHHASHFDAGRKTVMVCDDDRDLLQLFGLALKSRYNIILAGSGEDCIEKFVNEKSQGNKIHLLLLDYKLGNMHGDTVARKIKEFNGTRIILISAYELDDALIRELEENELISKYVEKPIHLANLIDLIADTITKTVLLLS